MAQTAGVLAAKSMGGVDGSKSVFFMTIDNVKFRRVVEPGDVLEMKVVVEKVRGKIWQFSGKTFVNDKLVSQATFKAMIGDK
jgi:3-hydroxyacyl-[acyl-carrier-protein] dehydratase